MADIRVRSRGTDSYTVSVQDDGSTTTHTVELDDAYYQKLCSGAISKEELLLRSFEFLLRRESKESILGHFHLSTIARYFPEYESDIVR